MNNGSGISDQMIEDYVKDLIREKTASELEIASSEIDDAMSFMLYGVDSLISVNLTYFLNEQLGIKLQVSELFDHGTVTRLAKHITKKYKAVFSSDLFAKSPEAAPADKPADPGEQPAGLVKPADPAAPAPLNSFKPADSQQALAEKTAYQNGAAQFETEPIAIIGMSGRFAKSDNLEQLWEHLYQAHDLVDEITRWDLSEKLSGAYCKRASLLQHIDEFDPLFFNISGLEATYMDPQQRLFLQESWAALEDAGYAGDSIDEKRCGVYVGCVNGDYPRLFNEAPPAQALWGNAASITPARIAYYLNLKGPAIAVDTACSSSLVAIHLACQGIWSGEMEMALAGGVFVYATEDFHIAATRAGMLSPTGRCHTFDENADGFVPGEGVGVVVLKRLSQAIADGDHICGVIKGSGINQDGATNGITAPSAASQEALERAVYDRFNIHPEQIQMIEAHGTGTKLGDPIEFDALTRAFRAYTDKTQFCAIGSIKTNLGHTTTAAGVTGVIKILLSLKHRQIPPSLNYQKGNGNIEFASSPFFVNTSLRDWQVEPGVPRRAAVSSFGFSGTNAHMVIEEAPQLARQHAQKPGYLVVLSAKSANQLKQHAQNLAAHVRKNPDIDLGNVSYTLLIGRRHLNHRLACVVQSIDDLPGLIDKWLNKEKIRQVMSGELADKGVRQQVSLQRFGNECIANCGNASAAGQYLEDLAAIAELYIQGYTLDYDKLFAIDGYCRVSLPTYPFARERYWVPQAAPAKPNSAVAADAMFAAALHPLLHRNTSDFSVHRFSTEFSGKEFFLADHVVQGKRVLPGVGYLEMARQAVSLAARVGDYEQPQLRLKDVVWASPIVVQEPLEVHIGLYPEDNGAAIAYKIYSIQAAGNAVMHSQGTALIRGPAIGMTFDIAEIKAQCRQSQLSAQQCYDAYRRIGVAYGPNHQGVSEIYVGQHQVLAKLRMPADVVSTMHQYVLHPSMMDSALQAAIGLAAGQELQKTALPFALQELEILGACTASMWAVIRYGSGSRAGDKAQKLDIDLCDESGKVCVRMKGFTSRIVEGELNGGGKTSDAGTLVLHPQWEACAPGDAPAQDAPQKERLILLCDLPDALAHAVQAQLPGARCIGLAAPQQEIEAAYLYHAETVFEQLQALIREQPAAPVQVQVIVPALGDKQAYAGLAGLLKAAQLENPKLQGQLIAIEADKGSAALIDRLRGNGDAAADQQISFLDDEWRSLRWKEVPGQEEAPPSPWKDQGVYLITGGAGGLGLLFAKDIAQRAQHAKLILTGRSALASEKTAQLDALRSLGAQVDYRQVDVADRDAVVLLVDAIKAEHGGINGIIHAAGVLRDSFLLKKTRQELQEVMAPKVAGLVNLDHASRGIALDFLLCFSSIAAVTGNVGQADYAAANAFMDAYAAYRNSLVALEQRHGRTLSVNWPLWADGGMRVDPGTEKAMTQQTGMVPLATDAGIAALARALACGEAQVLVLQGDVAKMKSALLPLATAGAAQSTSSAATEPAPSAEAAPAAPTPAAVAWDGTELRARAMSYLKGLLAVALELPKERIAVDVTLENYGVDSVAVMQIMADLQKDFEDLPLTLLFECETVEALTDYFLDAYQDDLVRVLNDEQIMRVYDEEHAARLSAA